MMPKKYKTRELRTLSLLILVALLAVLSAPSHSDSVALAQGTAPELTATSRVASQVELSWTEVSGAKYVIARYDRTALRWETLESSYSGTSRTDSSVQAGRSYTYQISADGRNSWSNQETVFVGHYDAPTLNTPTVSTLPSKIDVSWSTVAGTDNYDLWRFEQTEGWVQVADGQTGTAYADSSVDIGKNYIYQVQAHGTLGAGAWSAQQSATVPRTAPSMPVNLRASPGDAQVILTWTEPLYNGGSIVTGYQYRYQESGGTWSSWTDTSPTLSRAATLSSLTNGTAHNLEVRAQNAIGDGAVATASATPMSTVPGTPQNLRSTRIGPTEVDLAWDAVAGATGYEIQRRVNAGNWVSLTGVSGTSHTDTGLDPSTSYDYQILASNSSGSSSWSGALTVSTLAPQVPAAPVLTASADGFTITLGWTAPNDGGAAISSYEIEYSTDGSTWSTLEPAAAATATSYEDANLPGGTVRYYQIRAINSVGDGAWSASMSAEVAPAAPVLSAEPGWLGTPGAPTVVLTWTQGGDAEVTSYRIDKLDDQSNWAMEVSLPGSTDPLRYRDTGLTPSTVHTYRIIAINAAGESGESNSAAATTLAQAPGAPGPPTSLMATSGPGMVTLNWAAPLFSGGASVTGYQYRYREAPTTTTAWGSERWMSAGEMLSAEVKPLKPATEYEFQVRAVNSVGAGDPATLDDDSTPELIAARTPGATGPTAVPVLRRSLGTHDGSVVTVLPHQSNAEITLSWDALGGAAQNGGSPITGYELCYKKLADSAWTWWDAANDATVDAPVLTGSVYSAVHGQDATDGLLDPGTTYQYRARALNTVVDAIDDATGDAITPNATCTHWDGAWSAVVSATTPAVEPEAPTLRSAAGANTVDTSDTSVVAWDLNVNSITIKWIAPATNGGAAVTSYEVWVGTAPLVDDPATTDVNEIEAQSPTITNLPAVRLEYISVGLTAENTYYYRVRARNGTGNDRVSVWSNEHSGTTTATQAGTPGAPSSPDLVGGGTTAPADGNVQLTWTGPSDEGDSPILHYEVQYQRDDDPDDDDDWSDATTVTTLVASWTHMAAPGASMMEYRVRAVNASGAGAWSDEDTDSSNGSQPFRVSVPARAASAPMLTATSAGTDEILLEWNTPQDNGTPITGYVIQRWDPDPDDNVDTDDAAWDSTNAITLTDADATVHSDVGVVDSNTGAVTTPLMAGTEYFYRIQASAASDPQGTWSHTDDDTRSMVSATTDMDVPAMPVLNVGTDTSDSPAEGRAAPTGDSITLWWTAPGNGGSEITGYELRMWDATADNGDGAWVFVASPAADATFHTHDELEPGTTYHYILQARNAIGRSEWSADVSDMTVASNPDAPVLTAMATSSTSIRLTWTVPDDNGTPIDDYELQRWNAEADPAVWGANLLDDGDTVTEFVDTTVNPGTTYYYRIRAMPQADTDNDGSTDDEGWSAEDSDDENVTSATTPGITLGQPTLTVPEDTAPADDTDGVTANSITMTWTEAPVLAGGPAVTGYDVQIWNGSMWADEASLGVVTTYTDSGLMAGTKYYYRVRGKNSQGPGPWSSFGSTTTTSAAPDAPVLTAAPEGMNAIRLTWTVPNDNGTMITGYQLQRWNSTTNAWPADADNVNLLVAPRYTGGTLFVNELLDPADPTSRLAAGTRYHYRIRTLGPGGVTGTQNSAWSPSRSATTVAGRPGKPVLTATADGQTAINLSWTAAAPNGSAIVRYELQMWDRDARMWVFVHNALPSTRTTYRHSGLMADTNYAYRIRAVNRAADNGGNGYWSTIDFEKTAE